MDLIFWRHAEAVDADGSLTDLDRPLTKRGHKQAKKLARWLLERLPEQRRILVSPARRTCETADALGTAYEIEPLIAPGAGARALLAAAGWPGRQDTVLLVGHQPSLGEAAALLLTGEELGLSVRKGAVWWISGRQRGGRVEAALRSVIDPELP